MDRQRDRYRQMEHPCLKLQQVTPLRPQHTNMTSWGSSSSQPEGVLEQSSALSICGHRQGGKVLGSTCAVEG